MSCECLTRDDACCDRDRIAALTDCRVLSVLHFVVGAMLLILSCVSPYGLSLMGRILAAIGGARDPYILPGSPDSWAMLIIWSMGLLAGASALMAGMCLRTNKRLMLCLVLAVVEMFFLPVLGTALGIFTVIVLRKRAVRGLFDRE